MEEDDKYWLREERRECVFCNKGKDDFSHYIENYKIIKDWFVLGRNKEVTTRKV